jgi:hypothetical protein
MMQGKTIIHVEDLVDEEISAIAFVRDYVEFHFDGPILRSIANPFIIITGTKYHFPETGSRDALCRLIGSTITEFNLAEGQALQFKTSNECEVTIPLDHASKRGGDAMHFVPGSLEPVQFW